MVKVKLILFTAVYNCLKNFTAMAIAVQRRCNNGLSRNVCHTTYVPQPSYAIDTFEDTITNELNTKKENYM